MENNMRNKTNSNSSSNIFGIIANSSTGNDSRMQEKTTTQKTPIVETDPFKRAPKLGRSPVKTLGIEKPARARSSPPALCDTTPLTKAVQSCGDYMTELGDAIKKLIEIIRPPQRSINNNMRDLLGLISKLHASAQEEHSENKETSPSVLAMPTTTEATPKRPRDEIQPKRRTPPKRNKMSHKEALNKPEASLNKDAKSDSAKGIAEEVSKQNGWITVKRKPLKKTPHKPPPRPDAIIIETTGDMSYSEILRTVRTNDTLQKLGENVSKIRKTAKGQILLELKEAQIKTTGDFKTEIGKVLGNNAQIKALTHETLVEIRDMDEITSKEDIAEAIRSQIIEMKQFDTNSIRSIRAAYRGTQTAVIKQAIKKSKACCFKELCGKIDENPWGDAYKIVMSKFKGGKGQTPTCPKLLKIIVETLFPSQSQENLQAQAEGHVEMDVTTVNDVDVAQAAQRFDRQLLYDTDDGPKKYTVSGGVSQGSALGPLLWNVLYDGVLCLPLPKEVQIIGYADDIAVTVVAKELDQIQNLCDVGADKWDIVYDVPLKEAMIASVKVACHREELVLISVSLQGQLQIGALG
ncbi:uncharacterized protein [Bactrocera oleae]|uniref:uncharacterized protein n=1 Tax=Bactrocera oleae TaxID=104688 RepID=UPI00387EA2BB